jgi:fermentation-respiration switch protein FrsA (DUF1100 family)
VYLFGYSLGGSVALATAARERVAGVVTFGAFTSVRDLTPGVARSLVVDRFDNLAAIKQVTEPILLLHGTADAVVPFAHAERLQAAAPTKVRLLRLAEGSHHPDFPKLAPLILDNLRQMPAGGI